MGPHDTPDLRWSYEMTFTDAAAEVLRRANRPLHYKEITDLAVARNLLSHVGKSPEVTMGARLAAALKKDSGETRLMRVRPGIFALCEWDKATIDAGLKARADGKGIEMADDATEVSEGVVGGASADAASQRGASSAHGASFDDDDLPILSDEPEMAMRGDANAHAAELFGEDEDDDEPIFGNGGGGGAGSSADAAEGAAGGEGAEGESADGRRRRRRRRRGRSQDGEVSREPRETRERGAVAAYTATPAFTVQEAPRVDLSAPGPGLDDTAAAEFADVVATILQTYERGGGAISLRQIAETAQKHGKLAGDHQLAQSQVAAAVRADNIRNAHEGRRPRFRVTGGRVALTDWGMGPELARAENEVLVAIQRHNESLRRGMARKIGELPGHALVELTLLLLERIGFTSVAVVKRPGQTAVESHFSMAFTAPTGEKTPYAVVIRRDGRDVGRERVTELRGSMHHYAEAKAALLIATGFMSGAREEAQTTEAAPVGLLDAAGLASLCEKHGVLVTRTTINLLSPDIDLLEALRSS